MRGDRQFHPQSIRERVMFEVGPEVSSLSPSREFVHGGCTGVEEVVEQAGQMVDGRFFCKQVVNWFVNERFMRKTSRVRHGINGAIKITIGTC